MKKLLSFVLFVAMATLLASRGKSEPRTVAEKSIDCAIKQDYHGYFDCIYFPADKQEEKEAYINMIEAKVKKAKKKGNVSEKVPVSYEFVSEHINEDEGTAEEIFNIKYPSGKMEQTSVNLKKEEDGKWYIQNKK